MIDANHFITPNGAKDNWFRYKKKNKVGIGEVRPRFSNDKWVILHNSSLDMPESSAILSAEYHCTGSSGLQACLRRWGCQIARAEPRDRGWSQKLWSPGQVVRPDFYSTGFWWLTYLWTRTFITCMTCSGYFLVLQSAVGRQYNWRTISSLNQQLVCMRYWQNTFIKHISIWEFKEKK